MSIELPWTEALEAIPVAASAASLRVAVVIPCYRVAASIERVVAAIGPEAWRIYCVDDASGGDTPAALARAVAADRRVRVVTRATNGGVGAAVVDGIRAALADDAQVIVKVDGDGQMNPAFVADFVAPIAAGEADYVKGNRFYSLDAVARMPRGRLVGNAGLSFFAKLSTGYWDLFDPANGYVAIHADVARLLPLDKLHPRYFFESDLLFRLATLRARIVELPLETVYADETSHLSEWHCLMVFPLLHARNFAKRILYNYLLRNFSVASLSLFAGLGLAAFGIAFGAAAWAHGLATGQPATAGTVMLSALPLLLGVQLLLSFLAHDVALTPTAAIHNRLASRRPLTSRRALSESKESPCSPS
ncbi:MAG: glycosyltransferase family 2 protein [Alphaproteobacteria bacterium]|nr:glycosyltransferase family 2 protein [Alphaproteobacteria bacterium]